MAKKLPLSTFPKKAAAMYPKKYAAALLYRLIANFLPILVEVLKVEEVFEYSWLMFRYALSLSMSLLTMLPRRIRNLANFELSITRRELTPLSFHFKQVLIYNTVLSKI